MIVTFSCFSYPSLSDTKTKYGSLVQPVHIHPRGCSVNQFLKASKSIQLFFHRKWELSIFSPYSVLHVLMWMWALSTFCIELYRYKDMFGTENGVNFKVISCHTLNEITFFIMFFCVKCVFPWIIYDPEHTFKNT